MPISLHNVAVTEKKTVRNTNFQLVRLGVELMSAVEYAASVYEMKASIKNMHERISARPTTPATASERKL